MTWRPLKRTKDLAPVAVLLGLLLAAAFPGLLAPVPPGTLDVPYMAPDARHLLGTDNIGQDLLSELIYSARITLWVAFLASFLATFLGTLVGVTAGYFGGARDEWLMRITDVFLLLPGLPLIILLAAYMDSGVFGIALVIGMTAWPGTARVVRANVQQERGKNFIRSAQAFGAGNFYVMAVHILPNIFEVVLAKGALAGASAMVAEAGVSFLGLGDCRYKSWGAMLHEAFTSGGLLNGAYGWYLPPILCISMTVLCLTLMGQRWIESEDENPGMVGAGGHGALGPLNPGEGVWLQVKDLSVDFLGADGTIFRALDHVNLTVNQGHRLAVVGETGSGKSVLLLALMGLLPQNAVVTGEIRFQGQNLSALSEKEFRGLRGRHLAYVPQGAGQALNPLMRVGAQVAEPARIHQRMSRRAAMDGAVKILERMGIPHAQRRSREYPHQYSGGMIQRALAAMGLASGASLILLDEPTKGLDHQNRNAILHILKQFDRKTFVLVTHDLAFAQGFADRITVMLNSRVVETAPAKDFFDRPLHPYAEALLNARPGHGLKAPIHFHTEFFHLSGCPFGARCGRVFIKCRCIPPMKDVGGHSVRCWHYDS